MNAILRVTQALRLVCLTLLLACVAPAQERRPPVSQNGTWDISIWATGATGEENRNSFTEAQIWTAGVFVGRVITDRIGNGWRGGNLEYGFDLMPLFIQSRPETLYGGGVEPVIFRWNSSLHAGRVVPYIELAGGAVATNSNLPRGDTSNFNFTVRGGGGIHIFTRSRQSLDVGCKYYHVSNANLGLRNPAFNGVQISLGYHWFK